SILLMAIFLSGCSSKSWNWFYNNDDNIDIEEIVIDEEPIEQEVLEEGSKNMPGEIEEEIVYVYVDEEGNELYREVSPANKVEQKSDYAMMEKKNSRFDKPADQRRMSERNQTEMQPGAEGLSDNIVLFPYKKMRPFPRGIRLLEKHAEKLRSNPNLIVTVEGHTDGTASHEYNKRLGLERARSVARILQEMGVNPNQLVTISYGKERPLRRGKDAQSQALNRRVEIVY
ncbi:MAG: OmpA family protein, partial [Candidatus Oxydemutatoraceae bacterium WSBS_2016_MAG_OTU14]